MGPLLLRDERVPRHGPHGPQHVEIADLPSANLDGDHSFPLADPLAERRMTGGFPIRRQVLLVGPVVRIDDRVPPSCAGRAPAA
jgi:hypothetical protein